MNSLWAQSPWLQPTGRLLTQISFNTIQDYNQLYLSSGETFSTERQLTDNTLQAWFEYGLSDYTSVKLIAPFKIQEAGEVVDNNTGTEAITNSGSLSATGNVVLSWKQKLLHHQWLLTSHVNIEFPTAKYQDKTGLRSGYDAWAFSGSLSAGRGFGPTYFYAHLGIGARTNDYSTFYMGGFEWGYHIFNPIWVAAVLNVLQSFENGTREDPPNNLLTGLYVNDQEFVAWGIKLFGPIIPDRFGYNLSLFGAFNGNFVAKAPSINFGLYYLFSVTSI
jgi:hypothetical protein